MNGTGRQSTYGEESTNSNGNFHQLPHSQEVLDIVTAYKSLKLAMNKNLKGIEKGREVCAGKGYLKPTIASRQAKRMTLGYTPLTLSTQYVPDEASATLPAIRGSTAPAGAKRKPITAQGPRSKAK